MTVYENGRAPLDDLVKVTGRIYLPAASAARFTAFFDDVEAETGIRLYFTPQSNDWDGWNGYRPYDAQVVYREHLGMRAAWPGTSSHGLTWKGADAAAGDIFNWDAVPWDLFKRLAEKHGLLVDQVTPRELWHVIDPNPFAMPATAGTTPLEEDIMNAEQEAKLDALAADVAWLKTRVGGSGATPSLTDDIRFVKNRIGGSGAGASLTDLLRGIRDGVVKIVTKLGA